jgi:hypothetical protein
MDRPPETTFTPAEKRRAIHAYSEALACLRQAQASATALDPRQRQTLVAELLERGAAALMAQGVHVAIASVPGTTHGAVLIDKTGTHRLNRLAAGLASKNPHGSGVSAFRMQLWPEQLLDHPEGLAQWRSDLNVMVLPLSLPQAAGKIDESWVHELMHARTEASILRGVARPGATEALNTEGLARPLLPGFYDDALGFDEVQAYARDLRSAVLRLERRIQGGKDAGNELLDVANAAISGTALSARALAVSHRAIAAARTMENLGIEESGTAWTAVVSVPRVASAPAEIRVPLAGLGESPSAEDVTGALREQLDWEIVAARSELAKFRVAQTVVRQVANTDDARERVALLEALRPILRDRSYERAPTAKARTFRQSLAELKKASVVEARDGHGRVVGGDVPAQGPE